MLASRIRTRTGSTLVEALVALTLLAVGLLAAAGVSAPLARRLSDGARARRAAAMLEERVERLVAAPCPAPGTGARVIGELEERWTILADSGVARVADTVRLPTARGRRHVGLEVAHRCAP